MRALSASLLMACFTSTVTSTVAAHDQSCDENVLLMNGRAAVFEPQQTAKATLPEKNGWELKWHRTREGQVQLLAIHRPSLLLRRLNPITGALISSTKFPSPAKGAQLAFHSTADGEFLAATSDGERTVVLHSDRSDFKAAARIDQDIRQVEIISLGAGRDVFLAVGTVNSILLFKREGHRLEQVASVRSQPLLRRMFAYAASDTQIHLIFAGTDFKIRAFEWDEEFFQLEENGRLKEKNAFVQLGGQILPHSFGGEAVFVVTEPEAGGNTRLRLISTGGGLTPNPVNLKLVIGRHLWEQDAQGALRLTVPVRNDERSELVTIDPVSGRALEAIGIGDARGVFDLSRFVIGGKPYYIFNNGGQSVMILSGNETTLLPAPERTQIRQVTWAARLPDDRLAVAILGEGPGGGGVSIIALNR